MKEKPDTKNQWLRGYACAVANVLRKDGINTRLSDELFREGIQSIKKAREAGVDEIDIEEFKKYYS